jgi:hypothetical protein
MLGCAVSKRVPPRYDRIIVAELLLEEKDTIEKLWVPDGFRVLIIGAGVSGPCAAIKLQQARVSPSLSLKKARLSEESGAIIFIQVPAWNPEPSLFLFVRAVRPAIQNIVKSLTIFEKSAHWVAPNDQFAKPIPKPLRFLMREVPLYRLWYRLRIEWTYRDRVHSTLQKDAAWEHLDRSMNKVNDSHRAYFTKYIVSEIGDRKNLLE